MCKCEGKGSTICSKDCVPKIDLTKPMRMKHSKNPIRLLCTDRVCHVGIANYSHIVLVKHPGGEEEIKFFTPESFLENVENVPKKKTKTIYLVRRADGSGEPFVTQEGKRSDGYVNIGSYTFEYEE